MGYCITVRQTRKHIRKKKYFPGKRVITGYMIKSSRSEAALHTNESVCACVDINITYTVYIPSTSYYVCISCALCITDRGNGPSVHPKRICAEYRAAR